MTEAPRHRDARGEAQSLVSDGLEARVLEPSPPAVHHEPFAEDPARPGEMRALTPTTAGASTWDEWVRAHPQHASFAADHWLGAWRALPPLPRDLAPTRASLHQLAFYVLSPARRDVNGKIGLRWTKGGFGTPFFGDDVQLRVESTQLVVQTAAGVRGERITTLRRAAEWIGRPLDADDRREFDVPPMQEPDEPLVVDATSVAFLDAWFGLATSVLEQLRVDRWAGEPGLVQLWPEHFDVATDAAAGDGRATCGFSPGDDAHAEPYVYVAPWRPVDRSEPYWADLAFNGASLPWRALAAEPDQRGAALAFLRRGLDLAARLP